MHLNKPAKWDPADCLYIITHLSNSVFYKKVKIDQHGKNKESMLKVSLRICFYIGYFYYRVDRG